jgi:Zn-dependent M28 family amino/carboxypeptidase
LTEDNGAPHRRFRYGRIIAILLLVLLVGAGAGVGLNVLIAKPQAPKPAPSKSSSPVGDGSSPSSSSTKFASKAQFQVGQAMAHTYALTEQIGARPAGSGKESAAGNYISQRLAEFGYNVEEQPFTLPEGYGDRNIIATRTGTKDGFTIVIGAHYDCATDSKGAINNASGAGVLLELARDFAKRRLQPTLKFAFFGGNRPGIKDQKARLLGASRFVDLLGTMDKKEIVGMISIDSVGAGDILALRTQETGLQRLKDKLATYADESSVPVQRMKATDDSDNIPFEDAEVPAVWIEWCLAGGVLPPGEAVASVSPQKEEAVGKLVESFLLDLTTNDLEELKY